MSAINQQRCLLSAWLLCAIVTLPAVRALPQQVLTYADQGYGAYETGLDLQSSESPLLVSRPTWSVHFDREHLNTTMMDETQVMLTISYIDPTWGRNFEFHVVAEDPDLLRVHHVITAVDVPTGSTTWTGNFSVEALFLGRTSIYVELHRPFLEPERSFEALQVTVMRQFSSMDILFKVCVACFVTVLYVSFGAALEVDALKRIILRPVGPAIGLFGQFVIMPVLSFLIGYLLFPEMIELRLALFFTGSTPGGGASNIFTVLLNGNLNLSITMTAISNLAAFGMMPLWIFTLGAIIFRDGNFAIPYKTIAIMSFSLAVPLGIGLLLQRYAPRVAKSLVKALKPIALAMIIFITVFAFTVNSFMFRLFSIKILIASAALPWLGYAIGWLMAIACGQSFNDALTIAIETGIQNTGIAIFMLNFSLPQPQADMTSAVPVANSMLTPLPLLAIYFIQKCFHRTSIEQTEPAPTKEAQMNEVKAIANPLAVADK